MTAVNIPKEAVIRLMDVMKTQAIPVLEKTDPSSFRSWKKEIMQYVSRQQYDVYKSKKVAQGALHKEAASLAHDVDIRAKDNGFKLDDYLAALASRFAHVRYFFRQIRDGNPQLRWWAVLTAAQVHEAKNVIKSEAEWTELTDALNESIDMETEDDVESSVDAYESASTMGEPDTACPADKSTNTTNAVNAVPATGPASTANGALDGEKVSSTRAGPCYFKPCSGPHLARDCPQIQEARQVIKRIKKEARRLNRRNQPCGYECKNLATPPEDLRAESSSAVASSAPDLIAPDVSVATAPPANAPTVVASTSGAPATVTFAIPIETTSACSYAAEGKSTDWNLDVYTVEVEAEPIDLVINESKN